MTHASWRTPTVVIVAAGIVLGLSMGIRQSFGLFLAPMTEYHRIGQAEFGLAVAVQNLLWGGLTPFLGMLAERYGTGRFVALGGVIYVAGLLLMTMPDSFVAVHLGSGIFVGFAVAAAGFPLVLAAVARSVRPERRSLMLGLASAGGSVGQFLLVPGSQELIDWLSWQGALFALAGLSFLIVPLAYALSGKPNVQMGPQQSLGQALREAGRHSGFRLLTLGFFVCGFHIAFVSTYLPRYIVSCGLEADTGATALGIVGFFNIIGGISAGWLGQRLPQKYVLAAIYLLRSIIIAIFLASPKTELVVYLFSAGFGLLWLSTVPLTSSLVGQIFGPRYMATLFGFVLFSHQIGAFFGAWLGGWSYDVYGNYDVVWHASIALGVGAALLHWPIADKPLRQEQPA
ncbi:MAG TPA: MFS transporter [Kiloniellales bacterium]|nr:MFS transporter [Kiloniellales bacterium]